MGRPRSIRAHDQVLEAAIRLFCEQGIDATSMDAIAAESGVSKATIYKHWAGKDALCLEVMARAHRLDERPELESADTRTNLAMLLAHPTSKRRSKVQERLMPHLMAYGARHPAFAKAWRMRVMEPPRAQLTELLKKAVEAGELAPDLDFDLASALLIGPIIYRFFLASVGAPAPRDMPQRVVEAFWKAHARDARSGRAANAAR